MFPFFNKNSNSTEDFVILLLFTSQRILVKERYQNLVNIPLRVDFVATARAVVKPFILLMINRSTAKKVLQLFQQMPLIWQRWSSLETNAYQAA